MNQDDDPTRLVGRPTPPPVPGNDPGDQPTRIIRTPNRPDDISDEPTRIYDRDDDEATTLVGNRGTSSPEVEDDQKTILYRPNRTPEAPAADKPAATPASPGSPGEADEPVVGWLVVIKGNGAGHSHQLSYGVNSIGRDATQRISLDYGDPTISRQNHAAIAYDPKGRNFFIQQGGGASLAYLDDAPVLQPTKLEGGEQITLGDTTLSFVPFCSSDFDWGDE